MSINNINSTEQPTSGGTPDSFSGSSLSDINTPEPMEDVNSESTSLNLSPSVPADLKDIAINNLKKLTDQYNVAYGHFLAYQSVNGDSQHSKNAYEVYIDAEKKVKQATEAYKMFTAFHEPIKMQDEKKFSLVPTSLPFFQLRIDAIVSRKIVKYLILFTISVFSFKLSWKLIP